MSPLRARLLVELPLLIGVVVALGLLAPLLIGPVDGAAGSDPGQYLYSAEYIWTRSPEGKYYDWRKPFHPYLLGLLGNHVGYVVAGAWIARAAVALTVVEAALFARLLAGPWAGGAAALGLVWLPMVGPSTAWTNVYPLLGAACGLALVGAAWATRHPGPAPAALTAAAAGVSLLVDGRAASVALPCLLVTGVAVLAAGPWLRRAVGAGALLVTTVGFVRLDAVLYETFRVPRLPLAQAVEKQRHIAADARGASAPRGPADPSVIGPPAGGPPAGGALGAAPPISSVAAACDGAEAEALGWGALRSPCADATRAESLTARVASRDLPPPALLPLFAAALLPAGPRARPSPTAGAGPARPFALSWEARALLATLLLYGGAGASLWAAAGLAPLPDRYLAPYLVLLAALPPLAGARLVGWVARHLPGSAPPLLGRLLPALGGLLALGLAAAWTGAPPPAGPTLMDDERSARAGAAWIRATLGPEDRLYDCTGLDLGVLLLPDRPRAGRCPSELRTRPEEVPQAPTEGGAWLVARVPNGPGTARTTDPEVEALLAARGWVAVSGPPDAPSLRFWSAPTR